MSLNAQKLDALDPVWIQIREEAEKLAEQEPLMASLVHSGVLYHKSLEKSLSFRLAQKLASGEMSEQILREVMDRSHKENPDLGAAARADIVAVFDRDPACHRMLQPLLFFKGFQAVQYSPRCCHWAGDND